LWKITQHSCDRVLLERIKTSLDCGFIISQGLNNILDLRVTGLTNITNQVIPFFTDHQLHGAKL